MNNPLWYTLKVKSKTEDSTMKKIKDYFDSDIIEMVAPFEEEAIKVTLKNGKEKNKIVKKRIFPSLIFIKTSQNPKENYSFFYELIKHVDTALYFLRVNNTIIGSRKITTKREKKPAHICNFEVGQTINVNNSIYIGKGIVLSVNNELKTANVGVKMFGTEIGMDFPFSDLSSLV